MGLCYIIMPTIQSIIYEILYRPYKRPILILALVVLFSLATYFIYQYVIVPRASKAQVGDIANANRRDQTVTVFFFFADWCPHCTKAKPEWKSFQAKYHNTVVNGQTVVCVEKDCSKGDEDPKIGVAMQTYGVEHFPTVVLIMDHTNERIEFDGKITSANLSTFVETVTK